MDYLSSGANLSLLIILFHESCDMYVRVVEKFCNGVKKLF